MLFPNTCNTLNRAQSARPRPVHQGHGLGLLGISALQVGAGGMAEKLLVLSQLFERCER